MGYPRSHLVDPATPGVYHCVSRCVRRAFLCGRDALTGRCFEHRRQLIEDRTHFLAAQFSVSIHAYAVMSNHVHLVVATDPLLPKTWSDDEVQARWRRVLPLRSLRSTPSDTEASDAEDEPSPQASPFDIARWRERLGSLSWFMRMLLEPIARKANREDDCTGRFWEGRFFCQALLDERAILAACVYVDLNPHRAGMGDSLAALKHTGVALRIAQQVSAPANPDQAAAMPTLPPAERPSPLAPVAGRNRLSDCLPISTEQYLALASWTAGIPILAERSKREEADRTRDLAGRVLRKMLDCGPEDWHAQFSAIRERWRIAGGSEREREWLEQRQQRWIRRHKRLRPDASQAEQVTAT
jgi:hypothetical protein